MESMDLPGYFGLFCADCQKIRANDYSQNTVDGLQCMKFNNLIRIFICWLK